MAIPKNFYVLSINHKMIIILRKKLSCFGHISKSYEIVWKYLRFIVNKIIHTFFNHISYNIININFRLFRPTMTPMDSGLVRDKVRHLIVCVCMYVCMYLCVCVCSQSFQMFGLKWSWSLARHFFKVSSAMFKHIMIWTLSHGFSLY